MNTQKILLGIILLGILFITSTSYFKLDKIEYYDNHDEKIQNQMIIEILKENIIYQLKSEYSFIHNPEAIRLNSSDNKQMKLTDVINRQKLIFFFSDDNCYTCIESELNIFKAYLNEIGCENIIFLAKNSNLRNLSIFANLEGERKIATYNLETSLNLPLEVLNKPSLFLLDTSFRIKKVFIPEKTVPKLSSMYYDQIVNNF